MVFPVQEGYDNCMQASDQLMDIKQARAVILREWFALSPDQRATELQAAQFADKALQAHEIPVSNDNSMMVKSWLVRYTGLKPLD